MDELRKYTEVPAKPSPLETSDKTILFAFTKWDDPFTNNSYAGEAETIEGALHRSDCDTAESTCLFSTLTPITLYRISVRSCYTPTLGKVACSPQSPTIIGITNPICVLFEKQHSIAAFSFP